MAGEPPGDFVALGVVTRPQGVRGEVRVHPFNPDSPLLLEVRELVLVLPSGAPRRLRVAGARRMPKAVVLRFEAITSVEAAEALREATIGLPRAELPPPATDEVYLVDTLGLPVRLASGEPVGRVVEIVDYPSVTCLRVEVPDGFLEVPLLPAWVEDIDPEAGEVVLHTVEDLPVEAPRPRKGRG